MNVSQYVRMPLWVLQGVMRRQSEGVTLHCSPASEAEGAHAAQAEKARSLQQWRSGSMHHCTWPVRAISLMTAIVREDHHPWPVHRDSL
mmetsp:Transcript_11020/g.33033  ORF Transcript_11020/g.33033 Transcript_11020/m.33033 type:complete len:89 (+) Transcript_11020:742-1008(+)